VVGVFVMPGRQLVVDQIFQNTAETGLADGTAVTIANSDDGTAGAAVTSLGGSTTQITYDADAAKSGAAGFRIAVDTVNRYLRWDDPSPGGRAGLSWWWFYPGLPATASAFISSMRDTADGVLGSVCVTTTGKISWANASSTPQAASQPAAALTPGSWYRTQAMGTPGATTATFTAELKNWDTTGALLHSWSSSAQTAASTNPVARYRVGGVTSTAAGPGWPYYDFDNVRYGRKAAGDIGDVANTPPTLTLTANQNVAAGAAVTVTASASDPDGSIATYAWSIVAGSSTGSPALTGASTATVSFTAGAVGNLYTLQCSVTDNGGEVTTRTTEVRVPAAVDVAPLAGSGFEGGAAGWTIIGGSSSQGAALADGSSSTRVESPDLTSTPLSRWWRLKPMTTRDALRITLSDAVLTAAGSHASKVQVLLGASLTVITERATSTLKKTTDGTPSDLTTSDLSLYLELTPAERAAITDWGDVRVAVVPVV
jgi:hypothetical protein